MYSSQLQIVITFSFYTQVNPTPEEQTRKKKNVDDGKAVYVVDTSPELQVIHPDGVWFYRVKNVYFSNLPVCNPRVCEIMHLIVVSCVM